MTNGGADYCFECVGLASLMNDAFSCCRPVSSSQHTADERVIQKVLMDFLKSIDHKLYVSGILMDWGATEPMLVQANPIQLIIFVIVAMDVVDALSLVLGSSFVSSISPLNRVDLFRPFWVRTWAQKLCLYEVHFVKYLMCPFVLIMLGWA